MAATCPSLNIIHWSPMVTQRSTCNQSDDRTCCSKSHDIEPSGVYSFPERFHGTKRMTRCIRSMSCSSLRSHEDDVTVCHQSSDVGLVCQIHSVRALIKMIEHTGQRPGSTWCEALTLDLVRTIVNYWPDANDNVRSLHDQYLVSVSQRETLPRLRHLLNPCLNVLATKCITLRTCLKIFQSIFQGLC
jgi:hypothetical protein